jgi:hypothetical protein
VRRDSERTVGEGQRREIIYENWVRWEKAVMYVREVFFVSLFHDLSQ